MKTKKKAGILLDVGCSFGVQPNFIGISGGEGDPDIIHDLEDFPYPEIHDGECLTIICKNTLHKIKPWLTIKFMNEMWRMLRAGGQLVISVPYGVSPLYLQDPLSCNPMIDSTFSHFDHRTKAWHMYKPKPWEIAAGFPVWQVTGSMEIIMTKVEND